MLLYPTNLVYSAHRANSRGINAEVIMKVAG